MSYEVLTLSLPFIGGYLLTYSLYKFKIIKKFYTSIYGIL